MRKGQQTKRRTNPNLNTKVQAPESLAPRLLKSFKAYILNVEPLNPKDLDPKHQNPTQSMNQVGGASGHHDEPASVSFFVPVGLDAHFPGIPPCYSGSERSRA